MSRRSIIIVVMLAVISLGAIIIGQVFWVRKAYSLQEDQFNKRVSIALSDVVLKIREMNKDSAQTEPVRQVTNNSFIANINDSPPPYLLEDLLKDQFNKSNLTDDFEYGIYDCFTDSIVFGSRVSFDDPQSHNRAEQIHSIKEFQPDGHYFGVIFPEKNNFILRQLDFWLYSSIVIFFIAIFFLYTIAVILKQKRLSEIKADFVNNMTHELKTPISTISLSAEALSNVNVSSNPGRLAQYTSIIRNETARLRDQVEKVLLTETVSSHKSSMTWENVDLHEIIQRAEETYRVRVEELDGTMRNELKATTSIIRADVVHITNVIYNLLDNATKYSEAEPHIMIRSYNEGTNLCVEIKDNGIGILPEHQKMIFDQFYRVPTGNVHTVKGFGLGLFYVKSVLKAHHAKILVQSNLGKGSTFTLIFKTVRDGK